MHAPVGHAQAAAEAVHLQVALDHGLQQSLHSRHASVHGCGGVVSKTYSNLNGE